ncbi:MAG: DUF1007 family protein [Rhodospirillaceae bacterium]|nr:DUF1007 family protein [Rhodospirillaceae bacterium]
MADHQRWRLRRIACGRPAGRAALAAAALAMLAAAPASAHPHAFIDISVRVLFAGNTVTGLSETWVFDPAYTAFATYELGVGEGEDAQAALDALMAENLQNLHDYDYFSEVEVGGSPVAFATAEATATAIVGRQLSMTFVLPFAGPVSLDGVALEYRVYDPTFYIEMLHAPEDGAIVLEGAPASCRYRLVPPSPTEEQYLSAAALDVNATGIDGLGRLFAEVVVVDCRP